MIAEIIGETIFFIVFNFIGGTLRWLIGSFLGRILKRKRYKFKEYIYGPENSDSSHDSAHGCFNVIFGIGFIILIIYIFL